ncbi:MAG: DUF362 domain-containing protein [Spirochaetes bacterium]|nr:DUF362 domain-containing protein [Spirochaetota bacterium]
MKVIVRECTQYDVDAIKIKVISALQELQFDFSKLYNAKVAVKPNLLTSASPESAVITHPAFFKAIVQIIKQYGGFPVLIESPAVQSLQRVMKKTGYDAIVTEEDVLVADTSDYMIIHNENAHHFKRFEVPKILSECDIIFNLPKFKTHALTHITCAVKNLFGTIHGLKKSQWHIKAKTRDDFAQMLLDLYEAFYTDTKIPRTIVHVVDAITIMEGDGPGPSGTPAFLGLIGVSYNAIALDYAISQQAGFELQNMPTITMGVKRGLCPPLEQITIIRDNEVSKGRRFIPPKKSGSTKILGIPVVHKLLKNLLIAKPVPDPLKCTLCYQCKQICPVKAISSAVNGNKVPHYNYSQCIRCYCCMEICPESAITLSKPLLMQILK